MKKLIELHDDLDSCLYDILKIEKQIENKNDSSSEELEKCKNKYQDILFKLMNLTRVEVFKSQFKLYESDIYMIVCKTFGLTVNQLMSNKKTRVREYVICRQIIMVFANILDEKLTTSASLFGKDHATVLHSKKAILNQYQTDTFFKSGIDFIIKEIGFTEEIKDKFIKFGFEINK